MDLQKYTPIFANGQGVERAVSFHTVKQNNIIGDLKNMLRACAIDIDGVLIRGRKPIRGALESIQTLVKHHVPFVCLTNGGGTLEQYKAQQLSWMLTKDTSRPTTDLIKPDQMILSHSPMQELVSRYENEDVLIVGGGDEQSIMSVVQAYGFKQAIHVSDYVAENPCIYPSFPFKKNQPIITAEQLVEQEEQWLEKLYRDKPYTEHDFKAVMVLFDSDHLGRDCQVIIDVMRSKGKPGHEIHVPSEENNFEQHVKLYFSHQDFIYATNFNWPRFGQGLLKKTVEHVYKEYTGHVLKTTMFGKPYPGTYRFAERRLQEIAAKMGYTHQLIDCYYGVGDNPLSDIEGANKAGDHWRSVLTKTGVFEPHLSNDPLNPADYVVNDVFEFVDKLSPLISENATKQRNEFHESTMMPMVPCHWFDITDKFQHEETRKLWNVLVKTINCECNLATGPSSLNVNYGHLVHFLSQHLKNEKVDMREDLMCVMLQENLNMSELVRLTLQFGVLRLSEPRVSTVAEITSCLERASSLGNNNIMSMFYCLRAYVRGSCKLNLKELKNDCDLALHFSPNFTIAISNKARALTLEGQCPEAIELYKKCLQLVPNNSLTMVGLADALADMNCVDEALTWYNLAVSSDPDNTTALYNRGILHGERLRSHVRALSDCGLAYRSDGRGADQIARLVNHLRLTSSDPLCAAL